MLTEDYKPKNFDNFVGNSQNILSLQNWLNNWNLQNKLKIEFPWFLSFQK
jgi:hypothetical protein